MNRQAERGFTIIELLIATSVLAFILLLSTSMISSIGNLYYKGVNQSKLQDTARTIAQDVAQRVELQAGSTPPTKSLPLVLAYGSGSVTVNAICIGSTRYSYVTGWEVGSNGAGGNPKEIPHVMWRDTNGSGSCAALNLTQASPAGSGPDGAEMMVPNGSFNIFTVSTTGAPYLITVDLAYGDRTLLTGSGLNTACLNQKGDQFCANSLVTTTATPRTN